MADIKISQLSSIQVVNDADVFPIVSGGVTGKVSAQTFKEYTIGDTDNSDLGANVSAQIQTLANNKINKSDIANNLTTTTTGKVLDATQGKALDDKIPYFPNVNWTELSHGVRYKKGGGLVYLRGTIGVDVLVTDGELTIGTLPSGYRPYMRTWIPCGAELDPAILKIDYDGTVVLRTDRTTSFYLCLDATFPVQL